MDEAELRGVEHDPRGRYLRPAIVADVDLLSEDGMALLREVDADLVRASRLEHTRDERRGRARERLEHFDVRDRALRPLAADGVLSAFAMLDRSAEAVAAIFDEVRLDRLRRRDAVDERANAREAQGRPDDAWLRFALAIAELVRAARDVSHANARAARVVETESAGRAAILSRMGGA